jgi:hypothetical protein
MQCELVSSLYAATTYIFNDGVNRQAFTLFAEISFINDILRLFNIGISQVA